MKKLISAFLAAFLSLTQASCRTFPSDLEMKVKAFWKETDSWFKPIPDNYPPDSWSSAEETMKKSGGDCDDYSLYSCSRLSNLGFNKKLLLLERRYQIGDRISSGFHVVHLLEYNGLYGSSGNNLADKRIPRYFSIEELARDLGFASCLILKNKTYYPIEIDYTVLDMSNIKIDKGKENIYLQIEDRIPRIWLRVEN